MVCTGRLSLDSGSFESQETHRSVIGSICVVGQPLLAVLQDQRQLNIFMCFFTAIKLPQFDLNDARGGLDSPRQEISTSLVRLRRSDIALRVGPLVGA